MSEERYVVAVRELCEFAAKRGDLDLRFTPAPSAEEGIAGHRVVAARRGAGHAAEVTLAGTYGTLEVRGRADGWNAAAGVLEEVKTHKGELANQPANQRALHWAQAKVYAALLCEREQLPSVTVRLVYYHVGSGVETCFDAPCPADELKDFFAGLRERFLAWSAQERAHRAARDAALAALVYPHAAYKPGQRRLAENVYTALRRGACLAVEAGTGLGKTVGTLFPALKALPGERLDKVVFLSAKLSGQLPPLELLHGTRGPARVVQLVARDAACVHPEAACHGDSCPRAKGFYDRLPAARAAAVAAAADAPLDRAALALVAEAHAVCPYYLGQEMVRWADVVVADYHYWFDHHAMLPALAAANGWRVALLVDEAHNLLERGRAMYSAALDRFALKRAALPAALARPMRRLLRAWPKPPTAAPAAPPAPAAPAPGAGYATLPALPAAFERALTALNEACGEQLAQEATAFDAAALERVFDLARFARLAQSFGAHSIVDVEGPTINIRNVVPAPFLQPRFAAAHASVLFSATLFPQRLYADTLGLPDTTKWLELESPFTPEQLEVRVVHDVSTRWRDRQRSLAPIAALMARQLARRPGNYIAFFSSFDYLEQAADTFAASHPGIPHWRQTRGMDDTARRAFVARFAPGGHGIGFAVLGGSFAEGVDLPGERLVGAFIATLGLPQVNPVNEAMRATLDTAFGAGHDYTYLYPGIRKVVQAAGRVVRTAHDTGTVYLIDDRFWRPEVRGLLPGWWQPVRMQAR